SLSHLKISPRLLSPSLSQPTIPSKTKTRSPAIVFLLPRRPLRLLNYDLPSPESVFSSASENPRKKKNVTNRDKPFPVSVEFDFEGLD
ncbi:unnamed protein product, partial [Arabidopsis halleri]